MATRKLLTSICKMIDQINEEQPAEQLFLMALKKSIEMEDVKSRRKPSTFYKPSGMNCIRSMYFQATEAEVEEASNGYCSVGICASGTDIHNRIQDAIMKMKDNGFDCEYIDVAEFIKSRNLEDLEVIDKCGHETKLLHKTLKMHFMTDGILRFNGKYYILEIKTEISNKWNNRKEVDPKHYMQGTAYSISFGLDDVIFLYISRDTLDMKTFMFTPTSDMKNDLIGKIVTCEGYVNRKVCPPKPADMTDRKCAYCGYKKICKEV